jgi:outer membrane protein assembly factor BamE
MMKSIRTALPRARQLATAAAVMIALMGATGCVHRIDIQQGNFLDSEDIDRISVGMTRVQVRSLLGTPMVADPFTDSRWDYIYYLKRGRLQRVERRHFIVHFDAEDKVARIERPTELPASKS